MIRVSTRLTVCTMPLLQLRGRFAVLLSFTYAPQPP